MRVLIVLLVLLLAGPAFSQVRELHWHELVPDDAPPPPPPMAVHDLSRLGDVLLEEYGAPAPQQEPAAPVVAELDGVASRLPGYIVPLELSEDGRVIEFLLVPYFGACIHVPPPPSNQIVHVKAPQGVVQDALYQPFWVQGTLRVEHQSSELAEAGYSMEAQLIEYYVLD